MKKTVLLILILFSTCFITCDNSNDNILQNYDPDCTISGIPNGRENIPWIRDTIQTARQVMEKEGYLLFFNLYKAELEGQDIILFNGGDVAYFTAAYSTQGEMLELTNKEYNYLIDNWNLWVWFVQPNDLYKKD